MPLSRGVVVAGEINLQAFVEQAACKEVYLAICMHDREASCLESCAYLVVSAATSVELATN